MCEFFDLQANGSNLNGTNHPTMIEVSGRVTTECNSVIITVLDNSNTQIFQTTAQPSSTTNVVNGVLTSVVSTSFDNGAGIECGDRFTVTMTCENDPTCSLTETVILSCKDDPSPPCPDANTISIVLTNNGTGVSPSLPCIPAGTYEAAIVGAPSGSQFFWTLDLDGTATALASTNPTSFNLPPGSAPASLAVIVIPPNCPPIQRSIGLPDRNEQTCPTQVNFEVRRNGQLVTATSGLESGTYEVTVTSPVAPGNIYSFQDGNAAPFQQSTSTIASYTLMGNGASLTIVVTVDIAGCCPAISGVRTLTSGTDTEDPTDTPPNDTPPDNNDDDDGWEWPSLCGWLYGLLMVVVFVFIGLWVAFFSLFPASTPLWIALGVALVVVLAALAVYKWVCNVNRCRWLRILGWMFAWCALGCIVAWIVSWFTLWFLLIGALIAGIIAMIMGLVMAAQNCDFLNLFELP